MYYEINIANGLGHFFATSERSLTTCRKFLEVYDKLKIAFPENAGYRITATLERHSGKRLTPSNIEEMRHKS